MSVAPIRRLPSSVEIDRELCARSLRDYVEGAWHLVLPHERFVGGWHIDAICEHLEAVTRGEINRLVINVPPGSMKSLLVSVFWPTWEWTTQPGTRSMFATYGSALSKRDSLRARRIVESEWYRARWGHQFKASRDAWGAMKFENDKGGFRMATSVTGTVTGEHAHRLVADDLIKPMDAKTGLQLITTTALDRARDFLTQTFSTRAIDKEKTARVLIMQRLHEADPTGVALEDPDVVHLCLPMRFEPETRCETQLGFVDPRTVAGELLWSRFTDKGVDSEARILGARGTAAQHQQRPAPAGGNIVKRTDIRYWRELPRGSRTRWIQSWDFTFSDGSESDFVAGHVWLEADGCFYLVDRIAERLSFSASCAVMKTLSGKHPQAIRKVVENKANGPAIEDALVDQVPGIDLVEPRGDKTARMNAVEPLFAAHNVFVPDASLGYPWVEDVVRQWCTFPAAAHDDDCDAMTQALLDLYAHGAARLRDAMKKVRESKRSPFGG